MAPPKRNTTVRKLEETNRRNVTFSKRKKGLFNKVTELSILSHAETALIISSSRDKLYVCGYPSPDAVIGRFLTGGNSHAAGSNDIMQLDEKAEAVRAQYDAVEKRLNEEKKKLEVVMESRVCFPPWWESDIDEMSLQGLEEFKKSMESLRVNLVKRQVSADLTPRPAVVTTDESTSTAAADATGNKLAIGG